MRTSATAILIILTFATVCVAGASFESDAEPADGLLLSEVNPGECSGFALTNYGDSVVSLTDYSVSDGEGTLFLGSDLTIGSGEEMVFAKKHVEGDHFTSREFVEFGTGGTHLDGSMTFSKSGDDIYLQKDGVVVDVFCYGKKMPTTGWSGEPLKSVRDAYFVRVGAVDTDTRADWNNMKAGWYGDNNALDDRFDAVVTPFVFPDSEGTPIYRALEGADSTIDLSIYLLSSKNVLGLLQDKADEGVTIRVLLEYRPLGVNTDVEHNGLKYVDENGGDVRLINSAPDGDDRYNYAHNKYAVIDGDTVVVTSENWTSANMGGKGATATGDGERSSRARVTLDT